MHSRSLHLLSRVGFYYTPVLDEISKRRVDNGKLKSEIQFLGASGLMLMNLLGIQRL